MTPEQKENVGKNIEVAANTINEVVGLMQNEGFASSKMGVMTSISLSLVGINQALVAIAQAILGQEEGQCSGQKSEN